MSERINLGKSAPALYQAVIGLEKLATEAVASASIPEVLHICCAFVHLNSTSAHSVSGCILEMPYPVASQAIA
ncbi:hypothetical protein C8R32_104169 [Nitrosospira sp. Nsp5]|uniref:hypothetical protein n=1 Tax=Nitrosospira TaxID=35798 RepID=UPI000ACD2ACC|nr:MULTISPECIES: hypothetical protein [Nitrosospira]PTR09090.1 hypothetical protein C8R32_104169 [Nitrosospira sp. Nsp5]